MALKVTVAMEENGIITLTESGTDYLLAWLHPDADEFVIDQPAEGFRALLFGETARDLAVEIAAIITPAQAREVAVMPIPSLSL